MNAVGRHQKTQHDQHVTPSTQGETAILVDIQERAAIMHYDGGVPWDEALRRAEAEFADAQGQLFR